MNLEKLQFLRRKKDLFSCMQKKMLYFSNTGWRMTSFILQFIRVGRYSGIRLITPGYCFYCTVSDKMQWLGSRQAHRKTNKLRGRRCTCCYQDICISCEWTWPWQVLVNTVWTDWHMEELGWLVLEICWHSFQSSQ